MKISFNTEPNQLKDPVCGMDVSRDSKYYYNYSGDDYYFCSEQCLLKFKQNPQNYLEESEPICNDKESCSIDTHETHKEESQATQYTCPMHPEIVQDHPGSCPKCGMALEPMSARVEEKNEELIDMSRRFWISAALTLPLFILAMIADMMPQLLPDGLSMKTVQYIEFFLATPVVVWGGWPFFVKGYNSLKPESGLARAHGSPRPRRPPSEPNSQPCRHSLPSRG